MAKPGKTGFTRLIDATGYSIKGIKAAWINEAAFRQEVVMALVLLPAAFWLQSDVVELCLLVGSVMLVLIVEILNSAIEAIVDKTSPELHELAGRAKDMGSAAVMFSLLMLTFVWAAIAYERFMVMQ